MPSQPSNTEKTSKVNVNVKVSDDVKKTIKNLLVEIGTAVEKAKAESNYFVYVCGGLDQKVYDPMENVTTKVDYDALLQVRKKLSEAQIEIAKLHGREDHIKSCLTSLETNNKFFSNFTLKVKYENPAISAIKKLQNQLKVAKKEIAKEKKDAKERKIQKKIEFEERKKTRLVDNKDGTITDSYTGLIWMQKIDKGNWEWLYAKDICKGDWRMPNIHELATLSDVLTVEANMAYFNLPPGARRHYWSSTTKSRPHQGDEQFYLTMKMGNVRAVDSFHDGQHAVRCVKGVMKVKASYLA